MSLFDFEKRVYFIYLTQKYVFEEQNNANVLFALTVNKVIQRKMNYVEKVEEEETKSDEKIKIADFFFFC